MCCVNFSGVSPVLSCCGPKSFRHLWEQQPFMALHGWLLGQEGETLAPFLEKRPAPLPAFPTEPSPLESLTNGERGSWFLKNVYEYMHLCSPDFSNGFCFHPRWLLVPGGTPESIPPLHVRTAVPSLRAGLELGAGVPHPAFCIPHPSCGLAGTSLTARRVLSGRVGCTQRRGTSWSGAIVHPHHPNSSALSLQWMQEPVGDPVGSLRVQPLWLPSSWKQR